MRRVNVLYTQRHPCPCPRGKSINQSAASCFPFFFFLPFGSPPFPFRLYTGGTEVWIGFKEVGTRSRPCILSASIKGGLFCSLGLARHQDKRKVLGGPRSYCSSRARANQAGRTSVYCPIEQHSGAGLVEKGKQVDGLLFLWSFSTTTTPAYMYIHGQAQVQRRHIVS